MGYETTRSETTRSSRKIANVPKRRKVENARNCCPSRKSASTLERDGGQIIANVRHRKLVVAIYMNIVETKNKSIEKRKIMRTRNKIREDLKESAGKCKNTESIEMLLEISEICRKIADNKTVKEVSELEWQQFLLIKDIIHSKNARSVRLTRQILDGLSK